jgi:hypothetical protein
MEYISLPQLEHAGIAIKNGILHAAANFMKNRLQQHQLTLS